MSISPDYIKRLLKKLNAGISEKKRKQGFSYEDAVEIIWNHLAVRMFFPDPQRIGFCSFWGIYSINKDRMVVKPEAGVEHQHTNARNLIIIEGVGIFCLATDRFALKADKIWRHKDKSLLWVIKENCIGTFDTRTGKVCWSACAISGDTDHNYKPGWEKARKKAVVDAVDSLS